MGDYLRRFLFEHSPVRGEVVHLDIAWQSMLEGHDYPPAVQALLGEAAVACALMTATLKMEGRLTLQIQGNGAVDLLVMQCGSDRALRGMARYSGDVAGSMLAEICGTGHLAITLEPSNGGERYQGIVALGDGDLAAALEGYFSQSEQLPTRFWLSADDRQAGGMLLQKLPGEDGETLWQRTTMLASTLRDGELLEVDAETLVRRLFHEEDVRLFRPQPIRFECGCSSEKIEKVLYQLGGDEARSILAEQGSVRVECEYCRRRYEYDAVDVERIVSHVITAPASNATH